MTNEQEIMPITTWLYAAPGLPPMQVVQALELAATALCAGGTDMNVPTMPAGQPLTLEQLRGMDGQEIKIVVIEEDITLSGKVLAKREFVSGEDRCKYTFSSFGETWIAYAYPPANIDREAWEPCSRCRPQENSLDRFSGHEFLIDDAEIYFYDSDDGWEGEEIKFCPWCGRPLTEGAWAELEKRVMGVKHYGT